MPNAHCLMPTIDAHIHFWNYDPVRDSWITEEMAVIRRNFTPKDAQKVFAENDVAGCIAVQADQSDHETHYLLQLARENDFIKGVVGWVDFTADQIEEQLHAYKKEPLLKGFRHIIQGQTDEAYFTNKAFIRYMSLLAPLGFTYDVLIYHDQLPQAIRFTEKYPDQRFILDHIAKPAIRHKAWKQWKEDIKELARNPNMYCKLSGMITEADWKQWQYQDLVPYMEIAAEYFGTDRLCFGSDWPVALVAGSYAEVVQVVRQFMAQVPKEAREKVMAGNTATFYKLG